jgi:hypothetical protein
MGTFQEAVEFNFRIKWSLEASENGDGVSRYNVYI